MQWGCQVRNVVSKVDGICCVDRSLEDVEVCFQVCIALSQAGCLLEPRQNPQRESAGVFQHPHHATTWGQHCSSSDVVKAGGYCTGCATYGGWQLVSVDCRHERRARNRSQRMTDEQHWCVRSYDYASVSRKRKRQPGQAGAQVHLIYSVLAHVVTGIQEVRQVDEQAARVTLG